MRPRSVTYTRSPALARSTHVRASWRSSRRPTRGGSGDAAEGSMYHNVSLPGAGVRRSDSAPRNPAPSPDVRRRRLDRTPGPSRFDCRSRSRPWIAAWGQHAARPGYSCNVRTTGPNPGVFPTPWHWPNTAGRVIRQGSSGPSHGCGHRPLRQVRPRRITVLSRSPHQAAPEGTKETHHEGTPLHARHRRCTARRDGRRTPLGSLTQAGFKQRVLRADCHPWWLRPQHPLLLLQEPMNRRPTKLAAAWRSSQ